MKVISGNVNINIEDTNREIKDANRNTVDSRDVKDESMEIKHDRNTVDSRDVKDGKSMGEIKTSLNIDGKNNDGKNDDDELHIKCYTRNKNIIYESYKAIGYSTSPVSELMGANLVLDLLTHIEKERGINLTNDVHILTDCMYGYEFLKDNPTWDSKNKFNTSLINLIRDKISIRKKISKFNIHRVAGHCDIDGNDRADKLARMASELASKMLDNNKNKKIKQDI